MSYRTVGKLLSGFEPHDRILVRRDLGSGRENTDPGRSRARLGAEAATAVGSVAEPPLWRAWSPEVRGPGAGPDGSGGSHGPEVETGSGDEPQLWRDWDLEPRGLDTAPDGSEDLPGWEIPEGCRMNRAEARGYRVSASSRTTWI